MVADDLLRSMHMLARWTVFIEPLKQVIQVPSGRLQGCLLCISRDGSIALIALDGCELYVLSLRPPHYQYGQPNPRLFSIYLVPASVAPLLKVYLGEDNLLLAYSDQRARLWDIKTREFWRSMSIDKVGEMLKQGGWMEWYVSNVKSSIIFLNIVSGSSGRVRKQGLVSLQLPTSLICQTQVSLSLNHKESAVNETAIGSTLILDVDEVLSSISVGVLNGTLSASQKESKTDLEAKRLFLRALISPLLTTGLNSDIDRICLEKLGAHKALFGLQRSVIEIALLYVG